MKRRAQAGMVVALGIAIAAAVGLTGGQSEGPASRAEGDRPELTLLTSLPIVFGETFSLETGGSEVLDALESRYRVVPIAVADQGNLEASSILLMAHASAQPAEALVELDRWVRDGGRLLLLADPMVEWHSARPPGDPLRPSPMFPDTGLLAHWGLRLDAPDARGPATRKLGGATVLTVSPGALAGGCDLSSDAFVARCSIGRGRAVVVADADFLNVAEIDGPTAHNLDSLLVELARLENR